MVEKLDESKRVKCPWCAELIMPEALICPFCRSKVTDLPAVEKNVDKAKVADGPPGMLRAMVLNLVCPGLGAWRLGHKIRGAVFFFLVTATLLIYAAEVVPVIQREVDIALRTGKTTGLTKLETDMRSSGWLDITFYAYVWSFFDIVFLIRNAKKTESGGGS